MHYSNNKLLQMEFDINVTILTVHGMEHSERNISFLFIKTFFFLHIECSIQFSLCIVRIMSAAWTKEKSIDRKLFLKLKHFLLQTDSSGVH